MVLKRVEVGNGIFSILMPSFDDVNLPDLEERYRKYEKKFGKSTKKMRTSRERR